MYFIDLYDFNDGFVILILLSLLMSGFLVLTVLSLWINRTRFASLPSTFPSSLPHPRSPPKDVLITSWFSCHWTTLRFNSIFTISLTWQPWLQQFYRFGTHGLMLMFFILVVFKSLFLGASFLSMPVPSYFTLFNQLVPHAFVPYEWQWMVWDPWKSWGSFVPSLLFILHYIIVVGLTMIWHELGHGLAAAAWNLPLRSFGIGIMGFFPWAAMHFREVDVHQVTPSIQLVIAMAGLWHNVLCVVFCFLLVQGYFFLPWMMAPSSSGTFMPSSSSSSPSSSSSFLVLGVTPSSSLYSHVPPFSALTSINGFPPSFYLQLHSTSKITSIGHLSPSLLAPPSITTPMTTSNTTTTKPTTAPIHALSPSLHFSSSSSSSLPLSSFPSWTFVFSSPWSTTDTLVVWSGDPSNIHALTFGNLRCSSRPSNVSSSTTGLSTWPNQTIDTNSSGSRRTPMTSFTTSIDTCDWWLYLWISTFYLFIQVGLSIIFVNVLPLPKLDGAHIVQAVYSLWKSKKRRMASRSFHSS